MDVQDDYSVDFNSDFTLSYKEARYTVVFPFDLTGKPKELIVGDKPQSKEGSSTDAEIVVARERVISYLQGLGYLVD